MNTLNQCPYCKRRILITTTNCNAHNPVFDCAFRDQGHTHYWCTCIFEYEAIALTSNGEVVYEYSTNHHLNPHTIRSLVSQAILLSLPQSK